MSDQVTIQTAINRPYDRESHILVVDDDQTLLKFFKIHLNKFFSKVIVAESAAKAMEEVKTKEIALVISDIRMPKTDGLELMKKLRKKDPHIPFLLISGEALSDEQQARVEKADGFLAKPFTIDQFHDFVKSGIDLYDKRKETASRKKSA